MSEPISLKKLVADIHNLLCGIPVAGPQSIHNMDLALQGLALMMKELEKKENGAD